MISTYFVFHFDLISTKTVNELAFAFSVIKLKRTHIFRKTRRYLTLREEELCFFDINKYFHFNYRINYTLPI